MEFRNLDIKILSANDLKDVNVFSTMDVYVVVSLFGDPRSKQRTEVDKDGGKNPKWSNPSPMRFAINETYARQQNQSLHFLIRSERTMGDKDVGEIYVPVKELLDGAESGERMVGYSVRMPSGKSKGVLNLSYKFGDKYVSSDNAMNGSIKGKASNEPLMAYPAATAGKVGAGSSMAYPAATAGKVGAGSSMAYPAAMAGKVGAGSSMAYPPPPPPLAQPYTPQGGYYAPQPAYPPPPQPGYGHTPAGYGGYPSGGYPPQPYMVQQPQKKKRNNFGLGLGAGLLGGLLVGDMISDAGDMAAYDAGYDDGFDF